MTLRIGFIAIGLTAFGAGAGAAERLSPAQKAQAVIDCTRPLANPRGARPPLYIWQLRGVAPADQAEAERLIRELDARGVALLTDWDPDERRRDASLEEALRIARIQKGLGLSISVDANRCFHAFCNGSPETAHIDDSGEGFFDMSFYARRKMGCPFALEGQWERIRGQLEFFCEAYEREALQVDMLAGDWEIDGPIEWNEAWAHSKRCVRCRERIPGIEDFRAFQTALRQERNRIQHEVFVNTIQSSFPKARIGNYAEYPCDGFRYWYDWFEILPDGAPFVLDGKARHRPWVRGFAETGYTMGMPVVYTWYNIWGEQDFDDADYRWFHNMLQVASNAAKSRRDQTPPTPLYPFVHWTTTRNPRFGAPPDLIDLSERGYRELLWHMLLRGMDAFVMWCRADLDEIRKETRPVHEVWAASLEYIEFLERGTPVVFDVPARPGDVVSGLALGDRVLVRRSRFGEDESEPIEIAFEGRRLVVPVFSDECRVIRFTAPGAIETGP
jgi:hypothetical protein